MNYVARLGEGGQEQEENRGINWMFVLDTSEINRGEKRTGKFFFFSHWLNKMHCSCAPVRAHYYLYL